MSSRAACSSGSCRSTQSKPKKSKKPTKKPTTSTLSTNKNDEALRKRLKKLIDKKSDSFKSDAIDLNEMKQIQQLLGTNDVKKFILQASKAEKTPKLQVKKVDKNKNFVANGKAAKPSTSRDCPDGKCPLVKKTAAAASKRDCPDGKCPLVKKTAASTSKRDCPDGKCPLVKKTAASTSQRGCPDAKRPAIKKPKASLTSKRDCPDGSCPLVKKTKVSTARRDCPDGSCPLVKMKKPTASKRDCPDGSCPFVKKSKATAKKAPPASSKSTNKKNATSAAGTKKTGGVSKKKISNGKASGRKSTGGRSKLDTTTEDDEEDDDESDDSSCYDCQYEDDSDDDSSDFGDGCNGGACNRQQKKGGGDGRKRGGGNSKKYEESSGSWETDSDDGWQCSKRVKTDWQCEKLQTSIDTSLNMDSSAWSCEVSGAIVCNPDPVYMKELDCKPKRNNGEKLPNSIKKVSKNAQENTTLKSEEKSKRNLDREKNKHDAEKKEPSKAKTSFPESCDSVEQTSLVPYINQNDRDDVSEDCSIDSNYEMFQTWGETTESTDSSDASFEEEDYYTTESNSSYSGSDDEYDSFMEDEETDDESDYSETSISSTSDDKDYKLPDGVEEDILIRPGGANLYDAPDNIQFDSDDSSPQIFEIASEECKASTNVTSQSSNSISANKESAAYDSGSESNDSCPQLVAIDFTKCPSFENVSAMEYSSEDSYSDCSDNSSLSSVEAEIIAANSSRNTPPDILSSSFIRQLHDSDSTLKTVKCSTRNNSLDFEGFMQRTSSKQKYKVVSISNTKVNVISDDSKQSNKTEAVRETTSSVVKINSAFFASTNTYQVLVHLKSPVCIHGTVKIKLIAGNVDVMGYQFSCEETREMFSPRGNLLSIQPLDNSKGINSIVTNDKLLNTLNKFKQDFNLKDIDYILQNFDATKHAIVLLERNDTSNRIRMVNKYMREEVFPPAYVDTVGPYYISEYNLRSRFFAESQNSVYIDPAWNSVNVANTSKLLVIGGKGVGKSTFLRYKINSNLKKLKRFLLIDLDIGQPEIFAPQTISATIIDGPLLGPGYFYGRRPLKSYIYGDINVVLSPHSYLSYVQELLKYCYGENECQGMPWIINTMGYSKGFGAELLGVIIEHLQPTDVVQLQSPKHYNNFDYPMSTEVVREIRRSIFVDEKRLDIFDYKLFVFDSVVPSRQTENSESASMSAKDIRLTMTISMLGSLLSERDEWLTDVRPYCASIADLNIVGIRENTLSKACLLDAINANIVYLCNNSTNILECFGIGLVRGVDKYQQNIYLLPSVPPEILAKVNTLALCNIPLPTQIILNQGPKIKGVVPYTYNTNDFISSKHVPEHVHRPQHFLRGSNNILLEQ